MVTQNYANHRRTVPLYHFVLFPVIFLTLIGSFVNLFKTIGSPVGLYSASLLVVVNLILALMFIYVRVFPLKAQDRAIRAEENLRHFILTGKLLDSRLTVLQIVALRFASDEEFMALAAKAADDNLTPDQIKKSIKNWRGDNYRV
jgi:hypothetical protein